MTKKLTIEITHKDGFDKPDVKTEGLNYYEILAWLEMIKTNFIVSRLDKDTPKEENTDTTTTPSQKQ